MASLIRPSRPYPLPPAAGVVDHAGRPHVWLTERGKVALYPVSKDGAKYLKPARKWYGQYADAAGAVKRVPLSANKAAAQQIHSELTRQVERATVGLLDATAAHARTPLADHLADWEAALRAGSREGYSS